MDTSSKCAVRKRIGKVIGSTSRNEMVPLLLVVSTASGVQELSFEDGPLEFVSRDFPVTLNDSFCHKCVKFDPDTALLANCSVRTGKTYPAGSLIVGIAGSAGPYITEVKGFIKISEISNTTLRGAGDFVASTRNTHGAILVQSKKTEGEQIVHTYFEYGNQAHLKSTLEKLRLKNEQMASSKMESIWERTRGPTYTQEIHCGIEKLKNFGSDIQVYRSMQLENMVNPPIFDAQKEKFQRITEDDVYRAALAKMLVLSEAYNTHETNEYFTYTECAYFDWICILPLVGVFSLLMILYIVGEIKTRTGARLNVPFNSKTWFEEMIRRMQRQEPGRLFRGQLGSNDWKLTKWNRIDEAVLVNSGTSTVNVAYCRDGVMVHMEDALPHVNSLHSLHSMNYNNQSFHRSRTGSTSSTNQGTFELENNP